MNCEARKATIVDSINKTLTLGNEHDGVPFQGDTQQIKVQYWLNYDVKSKKIEVVTDGIKVKRFAAEHQDLYKISFSLDGC